MTTVHQRRILRHCKGKVGRAVHFLEQTVLNMTKDEFLVNLDNRQRFLEMLTSKMNSSNLYAIQSSGDAVNSATEAAELKSIVVVGKDTDLLMLLIHGVQLSDHSVFFISDEKSKTARKLWDVKYAKEVLGEEICNAILYSDVTKHQGCFQLENKLHCRSFEIHYPFLIIPLQNKRIL